MTFTKLRVQPDAQLVELAQAYVRVAQRRYATKDQLLDALGWNGQSTLGSEGLRLEISEQISLYVDFEMAGLTLRNGNRKAGIVKYIPQECERIPYVVVYPDTATPFSDKQLLYLSRNPHSRVLRVPNEAALNNLFVNFAKLINPEQSYKRRPNTTPPLFEKRGFYVSRRIDRTATRYLEVSSN